MNWDTQLNSILTATDGNVATIKQRLIPARSFSKEPLFDKLSPSRSSFDDSLGRPWDVGTTCADTTHHRMSSEDLAALGNQLQSQAKTIDSLNQAVRRLEKEREYQNQRMQNLEEEVRRLQHSGRSTADTALERRVEGLRRDLSGELQSLRERVLERPDRGMATGQSSITTLMEEVNDSKQTLWKEYESVRREIDQMKQKIRRQEEDLLRQITDSHETRRGHDRNNKMLEELLDSYRSNSLDLNRSKSESQQIQLELQHIKSTVSNLRDEMRKLHAERPPPARKERSRQAKTTWGKKSAVSSSGEEDSTPELSLGDISSDDISSVLDFRRESRKHGFEGESRISSDLEAGARAELGSDLGEDEYDGGDLSNDLEGLCDGPPELNFSDL